MLPFIKLEVRLAILFQLIIWGGIRKCKVVFDNLMVVCYYDYL